jgi:hypothetical protein
VYLHFELDFSLYQKSVHFIHLNPITHQNLIAVEARVWCTDGLIADHTTDHSLTHMRMSKNKTVLFWGREHQIDSKIHMQKPMKLYKSMKLKEAKVVCKKLNDRIAMLIAPTQRVWVHYHNLAAQFMEAANEYTVAYSVMEK